MIATILNKILDELNKESPKLDYIRGMVEVLLASQPKEEFYKGQTFSTSLMEERKTDFEKSNPTSEQDILDARARAAIETVKSMSTEE